jgi:formylglycine-generating enzyme required for sulfatase activity
LRLVLGNKIIDPTEQTFSVAGVQFNMTTVKGGTFTMGSDTGGSDSRPAHQVTLSSYAIGQTEVTQKLWKAVMGENPNEEDDGDVGDKLPVTCVSWNDCQTFISKLNLLLSGQLGDKEFRLPTEAQWEFAARGGNKSKGYTYSGSNSVGNVAWYKGNSNVLQPVATKQSNELGIYDMSGNAFEWCSDWYDQHYPTGPQTDPTGPAQAIVIDNKFSYTVIRGGSVENSETFCNVTERVGWDKKTTKDDIGLRLALK